MAVFFASLRKENAWTMPTSTRGLYKMLDYLPVSMTALFFRKEIVIKKKNPSSFSENGYSVKNS